MQLRNGLSISRDSNKRRNIDNQSKIEYFNGSKNPYDIKLRPSSAPPDKGRSVEMPYRKLKYNDTNDNKATNNKNLNNQKTYELKFQPKMSAVSAVQRVITDSITKVVAKHPFRKPETTDDELVKLSEIPAVSKISSKKKTSSSKIIRPKTATGMQKSAT